jgi:hypothetical protein
MKSTVDEVRPRFDATVNRFSTLETGQSATVDAPLPLVADSPQRSRRRTPATSSTRRVRGAGQHLWGRPDAAAWLGPPHRGGLHLDGGIGPSKKVWC